MPFSSSSWPVRQEDAFGTDPDDLYGRASDRFCQYPSGSVEMGLSMARRYGSSRSGVAFSDATKAAVWRKAVVVFGVDPSVRRKDTCDAWVDWSKYGDVTPGGAGWEIDHIRPVSANGGDDLGNLQPLQWENNRSKGDSWPSWSCNVRAVK